MAPADLWTGAVRKTPIRLEGDVGRVDEAFHLLRCLAAKHEGHQGVGVPVALQDMHVLVNTVGRCLGEEEIKKRLS